MPDAGALAPTSTAALAPSAGEESFLSRNKIAIGVGAVAVAGLAVALLKKKKAKGF